MAGLSVETAQPVLQVLRGLSLGENRLTPENLTLMQ